MEKLGNWEALVWRPGVVFVYAYNEEYYTAAIYRVSDTCDQVSKWQWAIAPRQSNDWVQDGYRRKVRLLVAN